MRSFWRLLPRLLLPAIIGLGLAYLATGFLPRPEPRLRPPEELRAQGQALDAESPVRAVLERNVLGLEGPAFAPPGSPPAPPAEPDAAAAALSRLPALEPGPLPPEGAAASPQDQPLIQNPAQNPGPLGRRP